MKNVTQHGFSLVELVVVIVIVGLLAVAALPRFLDVTEAAKESSVEAVAGGFATSVLSARAQWEALSRPSVDSGSESYNQVSYDGIDFWLTRAKDSSGNATGYSNGYPWALVDNDASYPSALTDSMCLDLIENLLQNPPQTGVASDSTTTRDNGYRYSAEASTSTGDSVCVYTQLEGNTSHRFEYNVNDGRVTVTLQQ